MKRNIPAITLIATAWLVSACTPAPTLPAANTNASVNSGYGIPNSNYSYGTTTGPGYNTTTPGYTPNNTGNYTPADLRNPGSLLAQRIIYFDFDRSSIKPEYMNILNAHAALLANYPNLRVRLEGHADERGSREYNVALSERRGYSVLDYLQIKGVRTTQMDVIGYGEEIPAAFGHNESTWSKNRRVEIKYAGE